MKNAHGVAMNKSFKVSVIETSLPDSVRGVSAETEARGYTVILNRDLSEDEKAAAFLHEMLHIYHYDFNSGYDVDQIETARNAELKRLLTI